MHGDAINDVQVLPSRLFFVGFEGGFPAVLKRLLGDENPTLDFVEFASLNEASADSGHKPDLILLDEICCEGLVTQANQMRRHFGRTMVAVAFSGYTPSPDCLKACLGGGVVTSFLPMDIRVEVWLAAVGLMLKGGRYVSPSLMDELLSDQMMNGHVVSAPAENTGGQVKEIELLTPRELEVLDLVARGQQNKIIAAELGISENTVKLHLHHIITKLNTSNRTEAAACYHVHLAAKRVHGSAR